MVLLIQFGLLILSSNFIVSGSETSDQELVNFYLGLINNRSIAALEYEFPTDARMYENSNENPQGKLNQHRCLQASVNSILFNKCLMMAITHEYEIATRAGGNKCCYI